MDQSCISIRNVGKQFAARNQTIEALRDVNLEVQPNEFITFVGASGCGKSTLLRIMAGLETHSSGDILLRGEPIDGPGVDRAMVFQHYSLYPWLTVTENIKFCRQLKVIADSVHSQSDVEAASGRADALLNLMGLKNFAGAYPSQLSGGMQQRVAIAQALIMEPEIILLDEPFGALDEATREELQEMLLQFYEENKKAIAEGKKPPYTLIIVTHELNEAIRVGDRLVGLSQYWDWKADGHQRSPGATVVYDKPAPVFRSDERPDYELFADIRREIRQVVYNPEVLQQRDEHVKLSPTS